MIPGNDRPRRSSREAGFAVSAEILVIALILVVGLVSGWVKLRDQSLAELEDSINALDTFNIGISAALQPLGTRWITGVNSIEDPPATGPITAQFTGGGAYDTVDLIYDPATLLSTAVNDNGENEDVIP